jgi:hypothetical protein
MCTQNYDATSRVIREKNKREKFSIAEKDLT